MKNILTINPGSTAVKYVLFSGEGVMIEKKEFDRKKTTSVDTLEKEWLMSMSEKDEGIEKISIRIVHGGGAVGPAMLDADILRQIREATQFAPIHNALALDVIDMVKYILPESILIVSFDTDFHTTIPKALSTYPLPQALTKQLGIKKYGFHGLAVQSLINTLKKQKEGKETALPSKVIVAHLGGGCSVTAVGGGKSIDTTMGMTPLEGLMMITRSGSIGPGIIEYIANAKGWTVYKVIDMLNTQSGFYGMTGSKNTLAIMDAASKHQQPEKLAVDVFVDHVVKAIFAAYGTLQGCDTLIFSGGMGQNEYLQYHILKKLFIIGITEENTHTMKADEAMVLFENTLKI